MDFLEHIYNELATNSLIPEPWLWVLLGGMALCFIVQLGYYGGHYGGLARFRNNRDTGVTIPSPPVSVVVVVRENHAYFVENGLQNLLAQEYDAFEVIVVDCSYDDEIGAMLYEIRERNPHMHLTRIQARHNHDHSIKLAITVGIKAARYEHLVLTTGDAYPTSEKWLSLMAKGFINGEVVLGYCGIEQEKGLTNKLIRCSRMAVSVRWLSAAIRGKAYRGIAHNLGYTRSLYFAHKGFNYLNMNIGDDDLFIRKIVSSHNVSVVMNPHATVRQIPYGGLRWWASSRKFFSHAYSYYPAGARWTTGIELWSRFLFFASALAAIVLMPFPWNLSPLVLLLLRLGVVCWKTRGTARRLGERKLMWAYVLYDLFAPLGEACMALSRRIRPNDAIWRS